MDEYEEAVKEADEILGYAIEYIEKRYPDGNYHFEVLAKMTENARAIMISNRIHDQRQQSRKEYQNKGTGQQSFESKDSISDNPELFCKDCKNHFTKGEIAFQEKNNDDSGLCYRCKKKQGLIK